MMALPLQLPSGNAICYSGYRRGQSPGDKIYPSHAEILEVSLAFDELAAVEKWRRNDRVLSGVEDFWFCQRAHDTPLT